MALEQFDLNALAHGLPQAWKSQLLSGIGAARMRVLRMDGSAAPDERHTYPESLLVLDGRLRLTVEGCAVDVGAGQLCVIPAGTTHGVAPGSHGTLLIVEA